MSFNIVAGSKLLTAATAPATTGSGAGGSIVLILIAVALIFYGFRRRRTMKLNIANANKRIELLMKKVGANTYFASGTVVAGLGGSNRVQVLCAPGSSDLVFMQDLTNGKKTSNPELPADELGRIPRDAVNSLAVRDHSQTQKHIQTVQRLSVTRMALLGPFSLAAPKRKKIVSTTEIPKFYLAIDWSDTNGVGQVTIFEFTNGEAANKVENEVRRALKPKGRTTSAAFASTIPEHAESRGLKLDEKKCLMCAEIIKAEAIKCRYCGSDLSVP